MPIAYQEQAQLTCPACGADFEAPVWLILDAQEQPEATAALRRGELNLVSCPHCGNSGPAGAPLLFHDAANRRVIFAPAPGAEEHELREQARDLHALLIGSIPEDQRRPYLADVDIAQDVAGIAHLLERMDRRRRTTANRQPATTDDQLPATDSSAAEAKTGAPTPAISSSVAGGQPSASERDEQAPPLLVAVEAMLSANSPEELDRVLVDYPVLLEASTDLTLAQLADVAVEQRAFDIAESLRHARALLGRMASSTTTAAPPAAEPPAEAVPGSLPAGALQALLQAQSAAELEQAAALHPVLLRAEADGLLSERVDLALDEGNERLAQNLEERREALAQLRAASAGARVASEPGPAAAPLATLDEAVEALLVAEGEEAMAEVIDRYPVLLDDVADQALWQFASEARSGGDEDLARYAVECREMLRRVREELGN
jgi:hypothetical protein